MSVDSTNFFFNIILRFAVFPLFAPQFLFPLPVRSVTVPLFTRVYAAHRLIVPDDVLFLKNHFGAVPRRDGDSCTAVNVNAVTTETTKTEFVTHNTLER